MDYDVIVVGGGPAGASCSIFLGKKGIKTLLVDKASFPRDKACGDGVTGKSVGMIDELGIAGKIDKLPHERVMGFLTTASGGMKISFMGNDKNPGYTCKRYLFDNELFQLAKKTADAMENFTVTDVLMDDNNKVTGIKGIDKDGKEKQFTSKIVVGADGANSVIARKLGLNNFEMDKCYISIRAYYENVDVRRDSIEIHFMDEVLPGYFWIFPVGNSVCNVGLGLIAGEIPKRKINLKSLLDQVIKNSYLSYKFKNAKQISEIKGWNLPTGAQKRKRAGDGFILVGDAASLIIPFTGEGIGNALLSGKLAANTISNAIAKNDFSYRTMEEYEKSVESEMNDEFRTNQTVMNILENKMLFKSFMMETGKKTEYLTAFAVFITANTGKVKLPFTLLAKITLRYLGNKIGLLKDFKKTI